MANKLSVAHQKIIEHYKSLFSDISIYNKKGNSRAIIELIVNSLLLKYRSIDIEKENKENKSSMYFSERIKVLVKDNRILKKYEPALFFIYKESNFGNHAVNSSDDAGEESYIEALVICMRPIIKRFFDDEGLDTEFLNVVVYDEIEVLQNKIRKEQSKSKNTRLELQKVKRIITSLCFLLSVAILLFIFYIVSLNKDLDSKQEKINTYLSNQNLLEDKVKLKQFKIDSLKTILSLDTQKLEVNNGVKNEFNGNVGNVTNAGKIDKLEL